MNEYSNCIAFIISSIGSNNYKNTYSPSQSPESIKSTNSSINMSEYETQRQNIKNAQFSVNNIQNNVYLITLSKFSYKVILIYLQRQQVVFVRLYNY